MRRLVLVLMLCVAGSALYASAKSVYNFTLKSIDGKPVSLKSYHGKVLLLEVATGKLRTQMTVAAPSDPRLEQMGEGGTRRQRRRAGAGCNGHTTCCLRLRQQLHDVYR